MNQNIWGSHLWFSLHTISFNYPTKPTNDDKEKYKLFFETLQYVIPCNICKKNYIRHLQEHPITNHLNSKKDLVYWVIDMHNMVNAEIGKKILSYDVVLKKYKLIYDKNINLDKDDTLDSLHMIGKDGDKDIYVDYKYIINGLFIAFIILLIINLFYMM